MANNTPNETIILDDNDNDREVPNIDNDTKLYKILMRKLFQGEIHYKVKYAEDKVFWKERHLLKTEDEHMLNNFELNYFTVKRQKLIKRSFNQYSNFYKNKKSKSERQSHSDSELDEIKSQIDMSALLLKHKYFYHLPRHEHKPLRNQRKNIFLFKPASQKHHRTGLVFDIDCMYHFGNPEEPESPERYEACVDALTVSGLKNHCFPIAADSNAARKLIRLVHTKRHVNELFDIKRRMGNRIFYSNASESYYENRFTLDAVCKSVAQSCRLVNLVLEGKLDNGFCLIRPPGHHCDQDGKYGFCHVNNISIAAKSIQEKHPGVKIVIFDWDLHHGNGTEENFYDEKNVVYISVHQEFDSKGHIMFPGTGAITEVGGRNARGRNVNIPIPIGCGNGEYRSIFDHIVSPIINEFEPDIMLVSAGFDCSAGDPLGSLQLTPPMFGYMTRRLMEDQKQSRVVLFLEGGYNPKIISECATNCISTLLGKASDFTPKPSNEFDFLVCLDKIIRAQRVYWKSLYKSNPINRMSMDQVLAATDLQAKPLRGRKKVALKRYREENHMDTSSSSDDEDWLAGVSTKKKRKPPARRNKILQPVEVIDLTAVDGASLPAGFEARSSPSQPSRGMKVAAENGNANGFPPSNGSRERDEISRGEGDKNLFDFLGERARYYDEDDFFDDGKSDDEGDSGRVEMPRVEHARGDVIIID